jgi:3-oxoacyl-[acyl-carrier protein] reductase
MTQLPPGAVIFITGATGGIGREIAAQAARQGAIVAVHGSRTETVEATIAALQTQDASGVFLAAPADFHEDGAIPALVDDIIIKTGRLDAVIHCAITGAPGARGLFAQTDPHSYGAHAALVMGIFQQLCFATLPHLAKQGGTIIAFASDAGRFAAARQSIIGGAFGGLMAFVRNLAMEVGRDGVRVHCISPSYVADTPVFERFGERGAKAQARAGLGLPAPADIAPLVLFLCGHGARKITGQVISINGGLNA